MQTQSRQETKTDRPFLCDIPKIRERARINVESGAVTEDYRADRDTIILMLNGALATEMVCVLRYRRHYYMCRGINSEPIGQEFLEHSNEEQAHADLIALRIAQLGGEPDLDPKGLSGRSHAEYTTGNNLKEMIRENLIAERIAVDTYREMIEYIGNSDPTTRRMLEEILAKEEEHADELSNLVT